ncbi:nuclear transport factor 2 family protein [Nocardia sp. SSK8]|uniref:nuclear transport factor 2 family protein n=1 Tax=Nocardia sp. SSK8 TaxID=3120154 RepID=UPI00300A80E6
MTSDKHRVVDAFHRFAAGDIEVLRTLLHEDFLEHSPGNPSGRDAFLDFIRTAPWQAPS